jgi:hypothetical protein
MLPEKSRAVFGRVSDIADQANDTPAPAAAATPSKPGQASASVAPLVSINNVGSRDTPAARKIVRAMPDGSIEVTSDANG